MGAIWAMGVLCAEALVAVVRLLPPLPRPRRPRPPRGRRDDESRGRGRARSAAEDRLRSQ